MTPRTTYLPRIEYDPGETPSVVAAVDAEAEVSGAAAHDVDVDAQLLIPVVHNRVDEVAAAAELPQAEAKNVVG